MQVCVSCVKKTSCFVLSLDFQLNENKTLITVPGYGYIKPNSPTLEMFKAADFFKVKLPQCLLFRVAGMENFLSLN